MSFTWLHDGLRVAVGGAFARGRAQGAVTDAVRTAVRTSIRSRLSAAEPRFRRNGVSDFLTRQREIHVALAPGEMAEIDGIASGLDMAADELFRLLQLPVVDEMAATSDGCTALARGPVVAKNRDVRPELAPLQVVTAESDPDWSVGAVLSLGSLGAPGAYSSGLNAAGLALADTAVRTADYGPGLSRYVLMNVVLRRARSVAEALALIQGLPHAGGGTLVLADASGETAAVELRHSGALVERGASIIRTNHFTRAPEPLAPSAHSPARRSLAQERLARGDALADILATRAPTPLCWLPSDGDTLATISGAIYDAAGREARIAFGAPGTVRWRRFIHAPDAPGGWREVDG